MQIFRSAQITVRLDKKFTRKKWLYFSFIKVKNVFIINNYT